MTSHAAKVRSIGSLVRIDSGDDDDELDLNKDSATSGMEQQQQPDFDEFQSQLEKGSLWLSGSLDWDYSVRRISVLGIFSIPEFFSEIRWLTTSDTVLFSDSIMGINRSCY